MPDCRVMRSHLGHASLADLSPPPLGNVRWRGVQGPACSGYPRQPQPAMNCRASPTSCFCQAGLCAKRICQVRRRWSKVDGTRWSLSVHLSVQDRRNSGYPRSPFSSIHRSRTGACIALPNMSQTILLCDIQRDYGFLSQPGMSLKGYSLRTEVFEDVPGDHDLRTT